MSVTQDHSPASSTLTPTPDVEKGNEEERGGEEVVPPTQDTGRGPLDQSPQKPFFPDGGLPAWLCVVGAAFSLFVTFGFSNSIGVLQSYYQTGPLSSYTPSQIGWIASAQVFIFFAGGLLTGVGFDMFGPRAIILPGSILLVLGFMLLSLCKVYYQFFLCQAILIGLGSTMVFGPAFVALNTHFYKKRGLVSGIAASGSSLGGVIYPIALRRLISEVGFPWAIRIIGFINLALLCVAIACVTSRFPAKGWESRHGRTIYDWRAFKDIRFTMVTFSAFLTIMALFGPINYLIDYGLSYGMDVDTSFYLISILNACSIVGRILPGALADYLGRFNMQFFTTLLSGLFTLALWMTAHAQPNIIAFAALYGFSSGAFISLMIVLIVMISDHRVIGQRTGNNAGYDWACCTCWDSHSRCSHQIGLFQQRVWTDAGILRSILPCFYDKLRCHARISRKGQSCG